MAINVNHGNGALAAYEKMMNDSEFTDKMMNVIREDARARTAAGIAG